MSSKDSFDRPETAERLVPVRIETSFIEEQPEPASLVRLLNVVLRHRRVVIAIPLLLATVVCSYTLLRPRTWTSGLSFVSSESQQAGQLGRLSGLAAQFGVALPLAGAGDPPEFYKALLQSDQLLRRAVETDYRIVDSTDPDTTWVTGTLVDFLEIRERTPAIEIDKAIEELEDRMAVSTSPETRMVRLSVQTHRPDLSLQIAGRLMELVEGFNLLSRQSRAKAEREFIENRLLTAGAELRGEEDVLKAFLEDNRRIENSPELRFQRDRIQRRVDVHQQVVLSLAQGLEQAKIEEVRNTPVVTLVEHPVAAVRPDRRRLIVKGLLSLAGGLFLGIVVAFLAEFMIIARDRNPDEYGEFRDLVADAGRDIPGPIRELFGRLRASRRAGS